MAAYRAAEQPDAEITEIRITYTGHNELPAEDAVPGMMTRAAASVFLLYRKKINRNYRG
jgi:hypothetical protein